MKWIVAPIAGLTLVIGALILAANFGRELQRFFAPPPPVETATFTLNCLSGDQAASLLRPYLPRPQNPMWQAEDFDVFAAKGGIKAVTVRAPAATIARVPALLARFEADPQAACRNSVSPPP
ncbi:MAG TPA: hypothetical protein VJ840_15490 [Gemmatimonadaceae bacterium]|nr:hypothetical protein [Gemmatimonadaceae bacterium]